jgi:hypothetical protein
MKENRCFTYIQARSFAESQDEVRKKQEKNAVRRHTVGEGDATQETKNKKTREQASTGQVDHRMHSCVYHHISSVFEYMTHISSGQSVVKKNIKTRQGAIRLPFRVWKYVCMCMDTCLVSGHGLEGWDHARHKSFV